MLSLFACCQSQKTGSTLNDDIRTVLAAMETTPVVHPDDAADDMCIWIHPTNPSLSTIIGTDKSDGGGLIVYDLEGAVIQFSAGGSMNNVDIRYNFDLAGESVALVAAGNRTENTLSVYKVDAQTRQMENAASRGITVGVEEIYGSCMYYSQRTGQYYAFVNDKTGKIEQWRLFDDGTGEVDGKLVRTLWVESQPEGCVADDILARFYVGEENAGVWKFEAEPDGNSEKILVDSVGSRLVADVEGLAIYYARDSSGYLIVSSQGNDSYVIYEREEDHEYVGTFRIAAGETIDGTSNTDGIDVSNFPLGPLFSTGIFVVQDGDNPGENQNFKCVRWDSIARLFDPPLLVDTSWDPRVLGLSK